MGRRWSGSPPSLSGSERPYNCGFEDNDAYYSCLGDDNRDAVCGTVRERICSRQSPCYPHLSVNSEAAVRQRMVEAMKLHGLASLEFRDACLAAAVEFRELGNRREAAAARLSAGHVEQRRNNVAGAIDLFRQVLGEDWRWLTAWSVLARHEAEYGGYLKQLGKVDAILHYRRAWRSYRIAVRLARRASGKDVAYYEDGVGRMALELRLLALAAPKLRR